MLIAVTGSSGGVGTAVVSRSLKDGHSVRGIDILPPRVEHDGKAFEYVKADLCDYAMVLKVLKGCEAVIHGAAIPDPGVLSDDVTYVTNTTLSYNVLRACAKLGITRVCQLSSINAIGATFTQYGRVYVSFPINEETAMEPADPYSLSKLVCEAQAESIVRAFPKLRIASLRIHHNLDDPPPPVGKDEDLDLAVNDKWATLPLRNACWGWTLKDATARACLAALTSEGWSGHEVFFIVAPTTKACGDTRATSSKLAARYHATTKVQEGWFEQNDWRGFFDTAKAERILSWEHDDSEVDG